MSVLAINKVLMCLLFLFHFGTNTLQLLLLLIFFGIGFLASLLFYVGAKKLESFSPAKDRNGIRGFVKCFLSEFFAAPSSGKEVPSVDPGSELDLLAIEERFRPEYVLLSHLPRLFVSPPLGD